MILVVGATGLLGHEITRQLTEQQIQVRALVREDSDQQKVEALKELGAEVVIADLKTPDTLKAACQGVAKVVSTASSTFSRRQGDGILTVDRDGQLNLVKAADEAGVEQFVFISFPETSGVEFPLSEAKRVVEKALSETGMDWCSLQASYFMEIWLSPAVGFDFPNCKARIYGTGEQQISWISYKDVAAFVVAALDNPAVARKAIKIGGPREISPNEVVAIFEKTMGRSFEVEHIPLEALKQQLSASTDPMETSFAGLMYCYALGGYPWAVDMDEVLDKMPLRLTSVEEFAAAITK